MGFSKTFGDNMGDILNLIKYCEILVVVEDLVNLNINDYVAKPVLVTRKQNITGSVSFGRQIGFRFTISNTKVWLVYIRWATLCLRPVFLLSVNLLNIKQLCVPSIIKSETDILLRITLSTGRLSGIKYPKWLISELEDFKAHHPETLDINQKSFNVTK